MLAVGRRGPRGDIFGHRLRLALLDRIRHHGRLHARIASVVEGAVALVEQRSPRRRAGWLKLSASRGTRITRCMDAVEIDFHVDRRAWACPRAFLPSSLSFSLSSSVVAGLVVAHAVRILDARAQREREYAHLPIGGEIEFDRADERRIFARTQEIQEFAIRSPRGRLRIEQLRGDPLRHSVRRRPDVHARDSRCSR